MCIHKGWKYNDEGLFAQEIIDLQVICGSRKLIKEHTRNKIIPYTYLGLDTYVRYYKGNIISDDFILPIGEQSEIRHVHKYKRSGTDEIYKNPGLLIMHQISVKPEMVEEEIARRRQQMADYYEYLKMRQLQNQMDKVTIKTEDGKKE